MKKIVLIGAGGHAKSVVDTLEQSNEYEIVGFIDKDNLGNEIYHGYKVIGNDEDLREVHNRGVENAAITIGFLGGTTLRRSLYLYAKEMGYNFPIIIDDSAILAQDVQIGEGTYIGKRVVVNSDARIGKCCIINTAAIIEHECIVGDFSHIAVGGVLCGQVKIGNNSFVGANATVVQGCDIEAESFIKAHSLVSKSVD